MALTDASAARVVEMWLDSFDPPLPDAGRAKMAEQFTPLIAACFQVLREDAAVAPGTMTAGGDPVTGAGTVI